MSIYLTESDFLTVDLKTFLNGKQGGGGATPTENEPTGRATGNTSSPSTDKSKSGKIDWAKELKQRLDSNKQLNPESRKSDFEIESQFWLELFRVEWGEELAPILNSIDLLKKDFKKLGFTKRTNPLWAFLKLKYVQTELLLTKLINSNTYKVLHNVLAKHYVATSELAAKNDYNIIYCRDLYTKPITDMEKYLAKQQKVLPTNVYLPN